MNNDRLSILADYLDSLPAAEFDNSSWVHPIDTAVALGAVVEAIKGEEGWSVKPISSTAAGCAVAWATTIPAFHKAGLKLMLVQGIDLPDELGDVPFCIPFYKGKVHDEACALFFGITEEEARKLFMTDLRKGAVNSPASVAKLIRELVLSQRPAAKPEAQQQHA